MKQEQEKKENIAVRKSKFLRKLKRRVLTYQSHLDDTFFEETPLEKIMESWLRQDHYNELYKEYETLFIKTE